MVKTDKPVPENIQAIVEDLNINACHNSDYRIEAYMHREGSGGIGDRHDDWRLLVRNKQTKNIIVINLQWEHAHWHTYAVMMNGFNEEIQHREKLAQFEAVRSFSALMTKAMGYDPREFEQYLQRKNSPSA